MHEGWNIIPYITKHEKNVVTGVPLKQDDLISLTFHKNSEVIILPIHLLPIRSSIWWILIEETQLLHLSKPGVSTGVVPTTAASLMSDGGGTTL
ncbi:hypothetical protein REPUB_Repub04eG0151100 [Reevesia pubescens]